MIKKNLLLCILALSIPLFSQENQDWVVVKSFSFDRPFGYYEEFDPIEGGRPGISYFGFTKNGNLILKSSDPDKWWIFDFDFNTVFTKTCFWGESSEHANANGSYIILGEFSAVEEASVLIFNETVSLSEPSYEIRQPSELPQSNAISIMYKPYLTDNKLFAMTDSEDLVFWDLLPEGQTEFYNIEKTQEWLKENAERIGYREDRSFRYFGDFTSTFQALLHRKNWKDYIFPEGPFENLTSLSGFQFIGYDSKGLNYFRNPGYRLPIDEFETIIAIVDTWTRKVTFKVYDSDTWSPPRKETGESREVQFIASCAWAVHPNGDIYFFDIDKEKEEYQLKKLENTWWDEIGISQRNIGRINRNYVALREEPVVTASNNGFNYEYEFVWILEEGNATVDENGESTKWVYVQKLDGRKGWIMLSDVYFE